MGPLKKVKKGDPIRADDFNALIDLVNRLSEMVLGARGGTGIDLKVQAAGLIVALADATKERAVWVKLTDAPPPGVPVLPSACPYTYVGLDQKFEVVDALPDYGRPCFGDDHHIYPDLVGNLAICLRNPQGNGSKLAQLFILNEQPYTGPC